MRPMRLFPAVLLLALAGSCAFALEPVQWKDKDYAAQFKYFQEGGVYAEDTWAALSPEAQGTELRNAKDPAAGRQEEIRGYYASVMARWDSGKLRDYAAQTREEDVNIVRIWLGDARAAAMEKKLRVTRAMLDKAASDGLRDSDQAALSPYLTRQAISDLSGYKAASGLRRQAETASGNHEIPKAALTDTVQKVSGSLSQQTGNSVSKFFDGSNAKGDISDPVHLQGKYEIPKAVANSMAGGITGPVSKRVSGNVSGILNTRNAPAAAALKSAPPSPLTGSGLPPKDNKSASWTSDAYGYTVTANGQTQTFRDGKKAEAAIRQLPDGSVSKIILYGHGSPGMQTVGPNVYDAESTAALLKGKMAKGGVIQYSGCNTASIGGPSLNPAVGLSIVARRLLYFSLPYFQDRADGVPADQAKQQWEKGWNADLARDTSLGVKGAIVCGYRTFGLVPGRFPVVARLMGTQEATTPGYVAGKKACYQDGKEVPAP